MLRRSFPSILSTLFLLSAVDAQDIQWEKNLGGTSWDEARSIIQAQDGGFVIGGYSSSSDGDVGGNNGTEDFWVVKLDATGSVLWEKNFGGSDNEQARSIIQTADSGFALAGYSWSSDIDVGGNNGYKDIWVVRLDDSGGLLWEKNLGGSEKEAAASIVQTSDGSFVMVGSSESSDGDLSGNHGFEDFWVVKLDEFGNLLWEKNFGGSNTDVAKSIVQTSDGGFVVAGESWSSDGDVGGNNGEEDIWVLKLDDSGNILWEKNFGGSGRDGTSSIIQTSDGGIAVAGWSRSQDGDVGGNNGTEDQWVLRLDDSGSLLWEQNLGGSAQDRAESIVQASDGGFFVAGGSDSWDGDLGGYPEGHDFWLLKLNASGDLLWEKNFGGSEDDFAHSMVRTFDDDLTIAGSSKSYDGDVGGNYGGWDFWILQVGDPTSLPKSSQSPSSSLHPNPTEGPFTIDLEERHQKVQLSVRDLTGRTISRRSLEDVKRFRSRIDASPGLYLVEIQTGEGEKKVMKVRKE